MSDAADPGASSSSSDEKRAIQSIMTYVSQTAVADLGIHEDSKKISSDELICPLMYNGKRIRREGKSPSLVNAFTAKALKKHYQRLLSIVHSNTSLTHLDLTRNGLDSQMANLLGAMLEECNTLVHLNLSHNRIGEEGCVSIAEGIGKNQNTRLRELNLSYNMVYNEGGTALGQMIRANASLRTLNLRHCGIFVEGSKAIMAAVARNATLQRLHFANNSDTLTFSS
mmetsp:Transcript_11826/g.16520  ORF Transcript_11826/g.16520 Transcript_11826/m.16520 type:complete len:226 (-) Transcript_11826:1318-1995(-)